MTLAPRQIHLDFHTSEAIPDIAANFDPRTSLKQQGRRRLPQSLFCPLPPRMAVLSIKTVSGINSSQFEKPQFASGAGAGAARCRYQGAGIYHGSVGLSFRADPSRVLIRKRGALTRESPLQRRAFASRCALTPDITIFGSPHGRGVPAAGKRVGWNLFRYCRNPSLLLLGLPRRNEAKGNRCLES